MTAFQVDDADSPLTPAVWRCEGRGGVRVRAELALLTSTVAEFAAFAETVSDCFRREALTGSLADYGPGSRLLPSSPLR